MASSKRERELARMRAERQAARRAANEAQRRKQRQTVLSVIGGLVVVGIVVAAVLLASGGSDKKKTDSLGTTPSASATPESTAAALPGSCTYTAGAAAAKKVSGTPPTSKVDTTTPATITMATNRGEIDLSLNAKKAPCTVNSFTFLAKQKYFDGTKCHRLTTSGIFVLQCGDPSGTGGGGPGYQFADENLTGAVYPKGTVAMANAGPGTNGSQFFLVYKDTQLPAKYTPFGTITKGLDVLAKVAAGGSTPAGDGAPKIGVTIKTVSVA